MARQGGLIPLRSLQSLHVREARRDKVQVCVSLLLRFVCVCHVIIRNVVKTSEGLCTFYYVVVITAPVCVCVCIDKAERSRYDLLR